MDAYEDTEKWFLAAAVSRGIGRSWLARFHHLSEINEEQSYQAAPSLAKAKAWCRQMAEAPIHWEERRDGLYFGYVLRKYVERLGDSSGSSRYDEGL